MALYVRDDRVRDLAIRLAKRRSSNVTDAVRSALEEALAREESGFAARRKALNPILARFETAERRPGFTDRELYDEDGNPVL